MKKRRRKIFNFFSFFLALILAFGNICFPNTKEKNVSYAAGNRTLSDITGITRQQFVNEIGKKRYVNGGLRYYGKASFATGEWKNVYLNCNRFVSLGVHMAGGSTDPLRAYHLSDRAKENLYFRRKTPKSMWTKNVVNDVNIGNQLTEWLYTMGIYYEFRYGPQKAERRFLKNPDPIDCKYYVYAGKSSVQDFLKDNKAEKGDWVISIPRPVYYEFKNGNTSGYAPIIKVHSDMHIGIWWGDDTKDDRVLNMNSHGVTQDKLSTAIKKDHPGDRIYDIYLIKWNNPEAEITLKKWERDKKIYTGGNVTKAITQAKGNYSLSGAQYGIYKTQADAKAKRNLYKTVTLSGDNPAQAKFTLPANSTYYGREIKAPAKGYYINDEVFTISTHSGNKTIHVTEIPKTDPMRIVINKTDTKGNGLEGAKFEVRYYNQMLTKAQAENATPTKRWIYKSDKYGKVELNNKAQKIGGDTLYMDAPDGNVIGLYGTYTVREIEAPEGFVPSNQVAWGQVKEGSSRLILGFKNNSNKLSNESQKGKIGIAKTDKETGKGLTGIKFNVKLLESYDSASDVKAGTYGRTDAKKNAFYNLLN